MKIVLTVVLAAIILAAVWSGYRRGLILSAAQLAAIVVAFYGAALLAGQVSDRLLPVAEPFAGGYFEGQLDVVAADDGPGKLQCPAQQDAKAHAVDRADGGTAKVVEPLPVRDAEGKIR